MKAPEHKVKIFATQASLPRYMQKPYWLENPVRGWLGSGITDCNGNEIFEGDIIEIDMTPNQPLPIFYHAAVTFKQGAFKLKKKPLNEFSPSQLEVVGHIATEEQT